MAEPRRLRGHKATVISCIASRDRPGIVATAAEDGRVCWFDIRCKDAIFVMDVGNNNPISSLCFKPGNEDVFYVSVGNEVKSFDVHLAASWKPLHSYNYNKDEINQIACNTKSSFLAAADDGGDVKIISTQQHCLYKTLRGGHTSICSSVQFLPWRPWEVITGGLDSKLIKWDFSKGRPENIMDLGMPGEGNTSNMGQSLNPAFIHAIVVPEADMIDKVDKVCVVARGDGAVDVVNVESELVGVKSKNSFKPKKTTKSTSTGNVLPTDPQSQDQGGRKLHLDYSLGGHTASVSCVAFSMFGEKGKFIISGGNDKFVKVWDWCKFLDADQSSSTHDSPPLNINLSRKVNWLCTTPTDSDNLIICDTSKIVKVYSIM